MVDNAKMYPPDLRLVVVAHSTPGILHILVDGDLPAHSPLAGDPRLTGIRTVNPGAPQRARPKTFAPLETSTDERTFYEVAGV